MFKCKECGTEYQTKPDYCDCGNDTFEETVLEQPKAEELKPVEIQQQVTSTMPKPDEIAQTTAKTSAFEPYAIIIFSICIILSLIIILFVANPKPQTETAKKTIKNTETTNIPSVDKLWNSSTEGISAYQHQERDKQTDVKKKVEATIPIKQELKTNKPSTTTTKQPAGKPKTTIEKPKTAVSQQTQQTKTETKINPQELSNYKIRLRNHIASKIAFTSVVGDGECSFSFKISSSGVLTNKAPSKLSDNDSLNEAVYNALRQVYSYNIPPTGYKNETLKLTVRMYNNSFEVYLN